MNEFEIKQILSKHPHTKPHFVGVFAADELPSTLRKQKLYIVNLSNRNTAGSHWITIFVNKNNVGIYVDSIGLPPFIPNILVALSHLKYFIYNTVQIQQESSLSCGLFVVIFSILLCRGLGLYEIRLYFKRDPNLLSLNEHLVASLISKELITYGGSWAQELEKEIRKWRAPPLSTLPRGELEKKK